MKQCYATEPKSWFGRLLYRVGIIRLKAHPELQKKVDACTSMEELTSLLFSCGTLDEGGINAFDKRIDELEGLA
jgi:hypothetical protein